MLLQTIAYAASAVFGSVALPSESLLVGGVALLVASWVAYSSRPAERSPAHGHQRFPRPREFLVGLLLAGSIAGAAGSIVLAAGGRY